MTTLCLTVTRICSSKIFNSHILFFHHGLLSFQLPHCPTLSSTYIRLWFQTLLSSLVFSPFLPLSLQYRHTAVHHFNNFCKHHELCPVFPSVTSSLGAMFLPSLHRDCWVLLGKLVLQVGATAYSWSPASAGPELLPHTLFAPDHFFLPHS